MKEWSKNQEQYAEWQLQEVEKRRKTAEEMVEEIKEETDRRREQREREEETKEKLQVESNLKRLEEEC
jgi:hypothetical protein